MRAPRWTATLFAAALVLSAQARANPLAVVTGPMRMRQGVAIGICEPATK